MRTVTLEDLEDNFDVIMADVAEGEPVLVECDDPSANTVILSLRQYNEISAVAHGDELETR